MISLKMGGIIVAVAFIAGAFVASPELRAYAANTVGSSDIINESILSADIKNGEVKTSDLGGSSVTSSKIKDGEVKLADLAVNSVNSNKILNGAIVVDDVSQSFMKVITLNDDAAGNSAGWMPGTGQGTFTISDAGIHGTDSIVIVNPNLHSTQFENANSCGVYALDEGSFSFRCETAIPDGQELNYMVINFG